MISIKSSFRYQDKWLSFPGFLVSLNGLNIYRLPIDFLANRPDLEYCCALVETNSPNENLSRRCEIDYLILSDIQFSRYTIIAARTQGKLNKKLSWLGNYGRSSYTDSLSNLKWISAEYHWANRSNKIVKSIDSPILLFDSSRVDNLIWDWCSAFISFLNSGCLNIFVSHRSFSLGQIEFRFSDLVND
jgi:hypothetical protein